MVNPTNTPHQPNLELKFVVSEFREHSPFLHMWNGPYPIAITFSHKLHGQTMYTVMKIAALILLFMEIGGFISFILVFFQKKGGDIVRP